MASIFYLLLVVACTSAFEFEFDMHPNFPTCTTVKWGTISGREMILPERVLRPGIADWTVDIPDTLGCSVINGEVVIACDDDVAPGVIFKAINVAQIHRFGLLADYGTVTIKKYCAHM